MDTAALLKKAWEAVVESGVPAEVHGVALRVAVEDLRGAAPESASGSLSTPRRGSKSTPPAKAKVSGSKPAGEPAASTLGSIGDSHAFFDAVAHETGVDESDLRDVFHIEDGGLELKLAAKDLGETNKAKTETIATLLAGAVFGGTKQARLPFTEVHDVCKGKRCYDSGNASSYLKALPGFAPVGSGKTQALTPKTGWETEFSKAIGLVLGKPDGE